MANAQYDDIKNLLGGALFLPLYKVCENFFPFVCRMRARRYKCCYTRSFCFYAVEAAREVGDVKRRGAFVHGWCG